MASCWKESNNGKLNKAVSVALCTCEGSLFLYEQLNSLAEQTCLPGELIVCDDASTDKTGNLLKEFSRQAPFPVRLFVNEQRLGAVQNFSEAIARCGGIYLALCDQDDIWVRDKLKLTLKAMIEAEAKWGQNTPILVHSDLKVIDSVGNAVASSFMQMRRLKHLLLNQITRSNLAKYNQEGVIVIILIYGTLLCQFSHATSQAFSM